MIAYLLLRMIAAAVAAAAALAVIAAFTILVGMTVTVIAVAAVGYRLWTSLKEGAR